MGDRIKLSNRRFSITLPVEHELANGKKLRLLVTYGFENKRIKELFCADFKAGTDLHTLITDTCVIASKLLQHDYTVSDLLKSLSEPPRSILGSLILAAVELEKSKEAEHEE